jgi:hypothetical protein
VNNPTLQAIGYYEGNPVSIIDTYKERFLIINSHNPVLTKWVDYKEVERITWLINDNTAS